MNAFAAGSDPQKLAVSNDLAVMTVKWRYQLREVSHIPCPIRILPYSAIIMLSKYWCDEAMAVDGMMLRKGAVVRGIILILSLLASFGHVLATLVQLAISGVPGSVSIDTNPQKND